MSQKKRVRIYKAGGQQGAYLNPTAQWMMQMGGQEQGQDEQIQQIIMMYAQIAGVPPEEIIAQLQQAQPEQQQQMMEQMMQAVQQAQGQQQMMQMGGAPGRMDPQMQEIQPIQSTGMMDPTMQQPQEIDPQELMQIVMEQREQGVEFEEIMNMLIETVPDVDEQLLMEVVQEVQMMEQEQGLGEQPPIEDQELDEQELLRKGGSPKQLRKKFVKEYVKGGIAQNAKASEVSGDSAFTLLDFVGKTNKESLLKNKAEKLAESMFPEQNMPAMYRGGIPKAQEGDAGKNAEKAAEETYTKAQMEAYVKDQIENSQKAYQEKFQQQFQQYPGGYGYGVPGGYGYPYGPGMPSPRGGMWDVGGAGYPLMYNTGPSMSYAGVRRPQLGNLMNMFSKDPDRVSYSSNLSAEELKNVLGDDFQGYDRQVLDYDKRFLRKPFETHVRYTINRGTGKPEPITMTSADATKDDSESYFYNKQDKKRFNPFNKADRIIRRGERRGNIDSDYVSPPDSTSSSRSPQPIPRQELLDSVDPSTFSQETPPVFPQSMIDTRGPVVESNDSFEPDRGTWDGRQNFMRGFVKSQLDLNNRTPQFKTYYPGGPVNEQRKSISSQFFPESSYDFPNPMQNKAIFGDPMKEEVGFKGSAELDNPWNQPWEDKYSLMNNPAGQSDNRTPYIDEKTERGQSYIDPLAMYNFATQGFRNKEMRDQKNRNNLLMYGEMANQPIDVKRNQNPYAFNTGQLLDNTLTNNQPIQSMAKRGGAMGKYKAGGTYMLEEDVINKIKAAGGIIKFLD